MQILLAYCFEISCDIEVHLLLVPLPLLHLNDTFKYESSLFNVGISTMQVVMYMVEIKWADSRFFSIQ